MLAKLQSSMKKGDWQTARFAAAIAGYRIIRLGVELSILPWITHLGYSAGIAGSVFLVYSIFSMWQGSSSSSIRVLALENLMPRLGHTGSFRFY